MYNNTDTLLSPFLVSGIIGTTLSLTFFSVFHNLFHNSKIFQIWVSPLNLTLATAICFVMSFFSTMLYLVLQKEFLLTTISFVFLLAAGILISLLIIYLLALKKINEIISRLEETKQMPELFGDTK